MGGGGQTPCPSEFAHDKYDEHIKYMLQSVM